MLICINIIIIMYVVIVGLVAIIIVEFQSYCLAVEFACWQI